MTYQNLLDGVIEFIVNDGHGETQTVVPVAYTPNNDLYISGDQGGFEIVNTHPGSDLYTELELRGNWSGSGKSLLSINVKPGPRLIGVNGIVTWPSVNSVSHIQPSGSVSVYFENSDVDAKIVLTDKNGTENEYTATNGIITIPTVDLTNAIERRISLSLEINDVEYSQLFLLPETETEDFNVNGFIDSLGHIVGPDSGYKSTDLVDIYDVKEFVYSGSAYASANAVVAYNEDRSLNRILIQNGAFVNVHTEVDGTYRYIRACCGADKTPSLKLYFRTRG